MTATPAPGFTFSSWQEVNVFTFTTTVYDQNNDPVQTNVSVVPSPLPNYFYTPSLSFTMQPDLLIFDTTSETLTRNTGWQANFDPIPEPSAIMLVAGGLVTTLFTRRPGGLKAPTERPHSITPPG